MIRWLEWPVFLGLALGVHLLPFGFSRGDGDAGAGRDGGASTVAMQGASTDLAALVAAWDTPPVTSEPDLPSQPDDAPASQPAATPTATTPPEVVHARPTAPAPVAREATPAPPADLAPLPTTNTLPALPEFQSPPDPATFVLANLSPAAAPDALPPSGLSSSPAPERAFSTPQAPERLPLPETGSNVQTSPRPLARPTQPDPAPPRESPPATSTKRTDSPSPPPAIAGAKASGNLSGKAPGNLKSTGATTGLSTAKAQNLVARWGGGIRARIARQKRYPAEAGRASGTATVALSVGRDGRLKNARIARSSGNAALDAAALSAVHRAAPFSRAPQGLTDSQYSFTVPLRFTR